MLNFFLKHKLISKHQHGFLCKSSTTTNLLDSINDWTLSLKKERNVAIAYVDYSKAFDVVSHPKLLLKLTDWGIIGNLLSWIKSFLSNRTHCTRVGNAISRPLPLSSGVVQCSCSGPLLFTVYINDVYKYLMLWPNASCTQTMLNFTQKSLPTTSIHDSRKTSTL